MKSISNKDYHQTQRLLRHFADRPATNVREAEAARQAKQLLRKWQRKDAKR